ncbi:hypothetical protein QYF61_002150 [Mycteria americana]|uniref:Reverse transcriptase domain-containing protein n=1 Tax=Mycteria americana TaxID=33587 RepID=A0AAN7S5C4_MYCAM|nr:hypothetical protein QYF61_002150 [Mycteria americana]
MRDVESASEDARFWVLPDLIMYGQRPHRVDLRKGLATAQETPRDHPPPPAPVQKIENFLEQEPCKTWEVILCMNKHELIHLPFTEEYARASYTSTGITTCSGSGPVTFNVFINDLDAGVESTLSMFADDTKLGGAVEFFEGRETLQKDLDRLESWAITNRMKFNKSKCQILHLEWGNAGYTYKVGNERIESSPAERAGLMGVDPHLPGGLG